MLTLKEHMIQFYNEHAAAHTYIYGFPFKSVVYMVKTGTEVMTEVLKVERSGRDGYVLKFKPNADIKTYLLTKGAEVLCSEEYLMQLVNTTKYNRGEIFEKLVTEHYGQRWYKDNKSFTECGDINVENTEIQIKYEKSSFITEGQIIRLKAKRI